MGVFVVNDSANILSDDTKINSYFLLEIKNVIDMKLFNYHLNFHVMMNHL